MASWGLKRTFLTLFLVLLACCSFLLSCRQSESEERKELTVFVAASLTDVMTEVAAVFEEKTGVKVICNFGGSGTLAQHLLARPSADVYLGASEVWMQRLADAELTVTGTRMSILSNQLVVVANRFAEYSIDSIEDLCRADFDLLALGDPSSVPAGEYARSYLMEQSCEAGESMWEVLEARVSPAPDVRAALNQAIGSRRVVAIVYKTDAVARADDLRILCEIPIEEGPRIRYPVAAIESGNDSEVARSFIAFLGIGSNRELFEKAGFVWLER